MDFLAFLILAGGLVWLWRRIEVLEREVRGLRERPGAAPSIPEAAPTPPPEISPQETPAGPLSPVAEHQVDGNLARPSIRFLPAFDFEDLFGRLLPIWAGGVTLAVAGFFLVRWSIEAGLLTPPVRVTLAGLFGMALLAGAEAAYRYRERIADARVAQALAGAGLATLYAAFYLAGSTYGLIGPTFAFIGLAGVTAAAIALSFRFGVPSAVLALVGGFAAPALVGAREPNLPLLTLYLALVTGGLVYTGRRQSRAWIGAAALAGGLGWGAVLVGGDAASAPEGAALGAYLVLVGGVVAAFTGGQESPFRWMRVAAAGLAAVELAALVAQAGFGPLEWGLYLLLGAALAWFGWRDPGMREGGAVAAAVGVLLLPFWDAPDPGLFAAVAAGLALAFAGPPLIALWRGKGGGIDVAQAAGVGMGLAGALYAHFAAALPQAAQPLHAFALTAMAVLPALASHWAGRPGNACGVRWIRFAQAAAALVGYGALAQVLPRDALAWTAGLLAAAAARRGAALAGALATWTVVALVWAGAPAGVWLEAGSNALSGTPSLPADLPTPRAALLLLSPAIFATAAWRLLAPPGGALRRVLEAIAIAGAIITLHVAFRHAFAAVAGADFAATGVVERAAWEALLVALGWGALVRGWRVLAATFAGLALGHFVWFALLLHNPLWAGQAVGAVPLANALAAMYGAAFAALWLARRAASGRAPWPKRAIEAAAMVLLALLTLSELRQLFTGSFLYALPVSQAEDLLRSLAGILLAIGFLLWGARTGRRSWRIGSLAAMVAAVLKVFLIDAAGLEGLARIASFMALGFSLIGIGWFYNRQLRAPAARSQVT